MINLEAKVRDFVRDLRKLKKLKGASFRQIGEELEIDKDTAIEIFVRAMLKVARGCEYYGLDLVKTIRRLEHIRR